MSRKHRALLRERQAQQMAAAICNKALEMPADVIWPAQQFPLMIQAPKLMFGGCTYPHMGFYSQHLVVQHAGTFDALTDQLVHGTVMPAVRARADARQPSDN